MKEEYLDWVRNHNKRMLEKSKKEMKEYYANRTIEDKEKLKKEMELKDKLREKLRKKYSDRFMYDKDKYYILIYYFRYMLSGGFIKKLSWMSEDRSASHETIGYTFASFCDEEDIENGDYFENGVKFFYGYDECDEILVDYTIFFNALKLACDIYLEEYPEKTEIVDEMLEKFRKRYDL